MQLKQNQDRIWCIKLSHAIMSVICYTFTLHVSVERNYQICRENATSRITGLNLSLFILNLTHFPCWVQIMAINFINSDFFGNFIRTFWICRLQATLAPRKVSKDIMVKLDDTIKPTKAQFLDPYVFVYSHYGLWCGEDN